jgi:predicted ATPase
MCNAHGALAWWIMGYPDKALRRAEEGIALAREIGLPYPLGISELFVCMLHQHRREQRATKHHADIAINIGVEQTFAAFGMANVIAGWTVALESNAEEGIEQMRRGIESWHAIGAELFESYFLVLLAEGYAAQDEVGEALVLLLKARRVVEETGGRWWEAEVHRSIGELLLRKDRDVPRAQECFEKASRVAREQGAKSLELRATVSLARLHDEVGRRDEARTLLAPIYGFFTEGLDTADLKEAKSLLDGLQ